MVPPKRNQLYSTPTSDITEQASKAFSKQPPAIVQPAQMSIEQFKSVARKCFADFGTHCEQMINIVADFKGRWRDFGPTRELACDAVFGVGCSALNKRLLYWKEKLSGTISSDQSNDYDKKEEAALKQVEEARKESEPPKEPEPEKPAVHSADEKSVPESNGHATPEPPKRSQNGKPKRDLALWGEIEGLLGKAMNRVDELNRSCPCQNVHDQMIRQINEGIKTLELWRGSVK